MFTGSSYSAIQLIARIVTEALTWSVLHFFATVFSYYLLSSVVVVS